MPITSNGDAHTILNTWSSIFRNYALSSKNCVTHLSDNTNSMVVKDKTVISLIRKGKEGSTQQVFDIFHPCHLCILCADKGTKELKINVEDISFDLFYFRHNIIHKATLRENMKFNYISIKHVNT